MIEALVGGPALLILDNVEHLLAPAETDRLCVTAYLDRLLARLPLVQCLLTSRRRLALEGERLFRLKPLPVPRGREPTALTGNELESVELPEALLSCPSVALFVDRAQAVRPDFAVTPANAAAVAEACRRLEGIPLAIVLAAARMGALTPAQLLKGLENCSSSPTSRRRDAASRHRTLCGAIDWSFSLLPEPLQRILSQLSVFQGGWTTAAAEATCLSPRMDESLDHLCGWSLVSAEELATGMRFRLLEALREFAWERLAAEERAMVTERHARYYLSVTLERTAVQQDWREAASWLQEEFGNLRAAFSWHLEHDTVAALQMATQVALYAKHVSGAVECRDWLERALEVATGAPADLRALALRRAGSLAMWQGELRTAQERMEAALQLQWGLGNPGETAMTLHTLGWVAKLRGDYARAFRYGEEALRIWRNREDAAHVASGLCFLASCHADHGDYDVARRLAQEALDLKSSAGRGEAVPALILLGAVAYRQGDLEGGEACLCEALRLGRAAGDEARARFALLPLARIALRRGERALARERLLESLRICRALWDRRLTADCLETLAALALAEARHREAACRFAAADALRNSLDCPNTPVDRTEIDADLATLRTALGSAAFTAAGHAGRTLPWQQAVEEALNESSPI